MLPLHVVVDVDDEGTVAAAAAALAGLSEQQREEEIFLTLILDAGLLDAAAPSADATLAALGRGTADLVLFDWSRVAAEAAEASSDDARAAAGRVWTAAAKTFLDIVDGGRRRARALGLANAGLADVEALLSLAEEPAKSSTSSPLPRPAALAVELHPLLPQRKLVGVCRRKGVPVIALNPAGKNGAGASCSNTKALLESAAVVAAAAAENKSPREVRFRFFLLFGFSRKRCPHIALESAKKKKKRQERASNKRASDATATTSTTKNNKKWGVKKQFF